MKNRIFYWWRKILPVFWVFVLIHFLKDITQDLLKISTPLDLLGDVKENFQGLPGWLQTVYLGIGISSLIAEIFILVSAPIMIRRRVFSNLERWVLIVLIALLAYFLMAVQLDPRYSLFR